MTKLKINKNQAKILGINIITENDENGLKSVGSALGPKPVRIVIDGESVRKYKDIILRNIQKIDPAAKIDFFEVTGKIVGTVSETRIDRIKVELKMIDPNMTFERKSLTKSLKEGIKNKVKITKEQYNRIFSSGLLNENVVNHDLKRETQELLKYLYGKTDNFSTFWADNNLSFEDICDNLTTNKVLIMKNGRYQLSKHFGSPDMALNALEEAIKKLVEKDVESKEETMVEISPLDTDETTTPKIPKKIILNVEAYNGEIVVLSMKASKYVFYYDNVSINDLKPYAELSKRYIGKDEDGLPEFEYSDFEIDGDILERFINDNLDKFS